MKNLIRVGAAALMGAVMVMSVQGVAAAAPEDQAVTTTECVTNGYANSCETVQSFLAPFAAPAAYAVPYVAAAPYVPSYYAYPTYYGVTYPYAAPYGYRTGGYAGYGYHRGHWHR